jgi:hypothetical protein
MEIEMSIFRAVAITALLALPMAAVDPAFARPNDGRYQKSAEKFRQTVSAGGTWCQNLKDALDINEKEADKRAGTKEAKPYADEADWLWEQGAKAGCSWAA